MDMSKFDELKEYLEEHSFQEEEDDVHHIYATRFMLEKKINACLKERETDAFWVGMHYDNVENSPTLKQWQSKQQYL